MSNTRKEQRLYVTKNEQGAEILKPATVVVELRCFKCNKSTKSHPLPDGRYMCHTCWEPLPQTEKDALMGIKRAEEEMENDAEKGKQTDNLPVQQ